jgi:hypothetical protein
VAARPFVTEDKLEDVAGVLLEEVSAADVCAHLEGVRSFDLGERRHQGIGVGEVHALVAAEVGVAGDLPAAEVAGLGKRVDERGGQAE